MCFLLIPVGLGGDANVSLSRGDLHRLEALGELRDGVLSGDGRGDHALLTVLPVGRGGHRVLCCELERVDDTEDLIKVASSGGRVEDGELQPVVRTHNEDGTGGDGEALLVLVIGIEHAELNSQLPLAISDDGVRELTLNTLRGHDVSNPALVGVNSVAGDRDDLGVPAGEIALLGKAGNSPELGRAHGSVVSGVGEQDGPSFKEQEKESLGMIKQEQGLSSFHSFSFFFVSFFLFFSFFHLPITLPVVELDGSLSGVSLKVGEKVSKIQTHCD